MNRLSQSFNALYAQAPKEPVTAVSRCHADDLDEGDTLIQVHYSSINYKDALGLLGKSPIYRKYPIIGGIDLSGEVLKSDSPYFKPGDLVLVTGCGLGESHCGGYAEYAQVPHEWIVPLPEGLNLKSAMQLGTAGFTASLAIDRLEKMGQKPEMGPLLVTGASGGVGLFSVHLLSQLGFEVIATSAKNDRHPLIQELGATQVLHPDQILSPKGPLASPLWAGAIDNVGGKLLEKILPQIDLWGNVCSIGVAGGAQFSATVMPHILRGVSLLGVSSTNCPYPLRKSLWQRLATDLKINCMDKFVSDEVPLDGVIEKAQHLLDRKSYGRTVVRIIKN